MSKLTWLDEIEARANAATPGPWTVPEDQLRFFPFEVYVEITGPRRHGPLVAVPDARFIAHARTDVPRLCRAVRELYEALATAVPIAESWAFDAHPSWKEEVERAKAVLERVERGDG